jgi:hypothetical protein
MSGSMGKRKSVPDDLMGTILNESSETADEKQTFSESRGSTGAVVSWDEKLERVGITFNLSKQLGAELERLRRELRWRGRFALPGPRSPRWRFGSLWRM